MGLAFDAFSVSATVTPPGGVVIPTRAFWVSPLDERAPVGHDFKKREPRRLLVLPRNVGALPKGSVVVAVEYGGTVAREWMVDGIDSMEADHVRAIVTAVGS